MDRKRTPEDSAAPRGMTPFKKGVLVLLALLFLGSVAVRAFVVGEKDGATTSTGETGLRPQGFLPGQGPGAGTAAAEEEPGAIEGWLPLLTEGSFFALIGFALGYATRKIVKVLLIFVAIFFIGIQALAYADVMTVDWGKALELINRLVLNLREDQPITEVLIAKVPTAGSLIAGYFLGFRRG